MKRPVLGFDTLLRQVPFQSRHKEADNKAVSSILRDGAEVHLKNILVVKSLEEVVLLKGVFGLMGFALDVDFFFGVLICSVCEQIDLPKASLPQKLALSQIFEFLLVRALGVAFELIAFDLEQGRLNFLRIDLFNGFFLNFGL